MLKILCVDGCYHVYVSIFLGKNFSLYRGKYEKGLLEIFRLVLIFVETEKISLSFSVRKSVEPVQPFRWIVQTRSNGLNSSRSIEGSISPHNSNIILTLSYESEYMSDAIFVVTSSDSLMMSYLSHMTSSRLSEGIC